LEEDKQVSSLEDSRLGNENELHQMQADKTAILESPASAQHWWVPLIEFAVHILTGTVIFLGIAAPAVGLDLLLKKLSPFGVSGFILWGLLLAEKVLFGLDLFLFLYYLLNTSWHFVRGMRWQKQ
jgi:hypothetical protein